MVMFMRELIEGAMDDFRNVVKNNADVQRYLKKKHRTIEISLDVNTINEKVFHFILAGSELSPLYDGKYPKGSDICLKTSTRVMEGILGKTISPIKAFVQKDLSIKAPLSDMLILRKFFA